MCINLQFDFVELFGLNSRCNCYNSLDHFVLYKFHSSERKIKEKANFRYTKANNKRLIEVHNET